MWNNFKRWYSGAHWFIRLPVTAILSVSLVIVGFAILILGLHLIFIWPIRLLGWWVILYWIALIVGVVLELARGENKKSHNP